MNVHSYNFFIDVNLEKQYFDAVCTVSFTLLDSTTTIALDLVDNFQVNSVFGPAGRELTFDHDKHLITIQLPKKTAGTYSVQVVYEGNPPVAINAPWTGGITWDKDKGGNHWVGLSCPNEGSKVFIPSKDHPSDRPDSVAINIRVPEEYFVAANGLLEHDFVTAGRRTFQWKTRYPVSNYNINFTVGKLVPVERMYTTVEGHRMPVIFYVNEHDLDKADTHLDIAVENLSFHEKYFGEYPFYKEKFGLAHTSYLGMEHQTINAYGNHFKYDSIRGKKWDWLMLHEMGHEWWANKVTIADWADYWIHEGITTYADALYIDDRFGSDAYHNKMASIARGIKNEKPMIPQRNADTDLVYQGDIYSKGAYLMHTLRFIMGDEPFFKALKSYAASPANTYQNFASTDQFIDFFEQHTSHKLEQYIKMHLQTIDLMNPEVVQKEEGIYEVSTGLSFDVPVEVEVDGSLQTISENHITIAAKNPPVVDPNNWYLKHEK